MANFLIQAICGEIIFDFAFHLKEAVKYNNWLNGEVAHSYDLCEELQPAYFHSSSKNY